MCYKLELELIQTRMIQKPLLWVEVGTTTFHRHHHHSEAQGGCASIRISTLQLM
jgi:hypothetical protein